MVLGNRIKKVFLGFSAIILLINIIVLINNTISVLVYWKVFSLHFHSDCELIIYLSVSLLCCYSIIKRKCVAGSIYNFFLYQISPLIITLLTAFCIPSQYYKEWKGELTWSVFTFLWFYLYPALVVLGISLFFLRYGRKNDTHIT